MSETSPKKVLRFREGGGNQKKEMEIRRFFWGWCNEVESSRYVGS